MRSINLNLSRKGQFLNIVAVEKNSLEKGEKADALALVLLALEDAKAEAVVSIDLRGRSVLGDFMVIASGRSQRHVVAVADQLVQKLREEGMRNIRIEGLEGGDWVLLDTGDIIIHLFRPEIREFYNLEKMWQPSS